MKNRAILTKFYTSLSKGDVGSMIDCYHKDITFEDPAFGKLEGERVKKMWEMLLTQKAERNLIITFKNIHTSDDTGSAEWRAEYLFGAKKRFVINRINGTFKFKDGKIIEHIDNFSIWNWSKQALGLTGFLIGWTPIMKRKIQENLNKKLNAYFELN